MSEKFYPEVGTPLYLKQINSSYYCNMVKRPYTVIDVKPNKILIQSAEIIYPVFHYDPEFMSDYYKQFDGKRIGFFDTLDEFIIEDKTGIIEELHWSAKKDGWFKADNGRIDTYSPKAFFGKYEYFPYLD